MIPNIFDKKLLFARKKRSLQRLRNEFFLHKLLIDNIMDHMEYLSTVFEKVLVHSFVDQEIKQLIEANINAKQIIFSDCINNGYNDVVFDNELNSFADNSFDLVIDCGNLHFANDLPGALIQYYKILKHEGMLITNLFGGSSLNQLYNSLVAVESAFSDKVSARICPMVEVKDAGALLMRSGFSSAVADSDKYIMAYDHIQDLVQDLRDSALTNMLVSRPSYFQKNMPSLVNEYYLNNFSSDEGQILTTFEVITLTGLAVKNG